MSKRGQKGSLCTCTHGTTTLMTLALECSPHVKAQCMWLALCVPSSALRVHPV